MSTKTPDPVSDIPGVYIDGGGVDIDLGAFALDYLIRVGELSLDDCQGWGYLSFPDIDFVGRLDAFATDHGLDSDGESIQAVVLRNIRSAITHYFHNDPLRNVRDEEACELLREIDTALAFVIDTTEK